MQHIPDLPGCNMTYIELAKAANVKVSEILQMEKAVREKVSALTRERIRITIRRDNRGRE